MNHTLARADTAHYDLRPAQLSTLPAASPSGLAGSLRPGRRKGAGGT